MWPNMRLIMFFACALLIPATFGHSNLERIHGPYCDDESEFRCADTGECVSHTAVCDGKDDCADKSDELHCFEWENCTDPNYIQCRDKKCILNSSLCNSVVDCSYGEDEKNCRILPTESVCPSDYFLCHNDSPPMCISPNWVCDGFKDCVNGDDETPGCDQMKKCNDDEFECKNHKCIAKIFQCDGTTHCDDNSDEENCEHPLADVTNCTAANRKFACDDHRKCIDIQQICDKTVDCDDGSDEGQTLCSVPSENKFQFKTILACTVISCFIVGFGVTFYYVRVFRRKSNPLQSEESPILKPADEPVEKSFKEEESACPVDSCSLEAHKNNTPAVLESLPEEPTDSKSNVEAEVNI